MIWGDLFVEFLGILEHAVMIQDILRVKGTVVHAISPGTRLDEVAKKLVEHKIGELLVARQGPTGEQELLGIVTERRHSHHCEE